MAGRIPDSFIETLNDRVNIVDVISARVPLKKSGREYHGKCPFHDDSSPSFSVNPDKQVYHCFGCGASGGLITFVMEFDKIDFVSAIDSLASLAGLEVPTETSGSGSQSTQTLVRTDQRRRSCISKSSEISSRSRTGSKLSESTRTHRYHRAPIWARLCAKWLEFF